MRFRRTPFAVRRARCTSWHAGALSLALTSLAALVPLAPSPARADGSPPPPAADATPESRWETLRTHYFGDAEIVPGDALMALDAPARAHDAAVVPVAVRVLAAETDIRRLHLIVDQNPLPLAGIFTFAAQAKGWRTLETRIRVNEYTNVRAVAERADGSLAMVSRFVKAAGGCSAPAMADLDAALARAGRMRLLIDEATRAATIETEGASPLVGDPLSTATIKISHPNSSGMQFDQISRNYIPAFFVERIGAELDGRALIDVETNFSLSENPVVALSFPGAAERTTLEVRALDSKGNRYEGSAAFEAGGS